MLWYMYALVHDLHTYLNAFVLSSAYAFKNWNVCTHQCALTFTYKCSFYIYKCVTLSLPDLFTSIIEMLLSLSQSMFPLNWFGKLFTFTLDIVVILWNKYCTQLGIIVLKIINMKYFGPTIDIHVPNHEYLTQVLAWNEHRFSSSEQFIIGLNSRFVIYKYFRVQHWNACSRLERYV